MDIDVDAIAKAANEDANFHAATLTLERAPLDPKLTQGLGLTKMHAGFVLVHSSESQRSMPEIALDKVTLYNGAPPPER